MTSAVLYQVTVITAKRRYPWRGGCRRRGELDMVRVVFCGSPARGPGRRPCLRRFPFAHESASRSGRDRWGDGSTSSSTSSRPGFASSVMRRHVRAAAIFSAWLERQQLEPLVHPLQDRAAAVAAPEASTRSALGGGGRRSSPGHASMDSGCNLAPWPGRRSKRDGVMVAALRRSPRACARPRGRNPADVRTLRRSPSCRVRRDTDARLVRGWPCRRSRRSCRPGPAGSVCRHVGAP